MMSQARGAQLLAEQNASDKAAFDALYETRASDETRELMFAEEPAVKPVVTRRIAY